MSRLRAGMTSPSDLTRPLALLVQKRVTRRHIWHKSQRSAHVCRVETDPIVEAAPGTATCPQWPRIHTDSEYSRS